jgi:hypothetical protein
MSSKPSKSKGKPSKGKSLSNQQMIDKKINENKK